MNRRRYTHRITKKEQRALDILYKPARPITRSRNPRDAFSHSEQCDQFFSVVTATLGGVPHIKCQCWCHTATQLFESAEPEYDLTPPPEYMTSADAAFALAEPAHVRIGFTDVLTLTSAASEPDLIPREVELDPGLASKYPNRATTELVSGKCETCGDTLAACECVE